MIGPDSTRRLQQSCASPVRSGAAYSGTQGFLIERAAGPLFLFLALEERDVDLGAVDADKLASAIGQAGRRQQQKELLEIEALNGALNGQDRVVVRDGHEQTVAAPGAVNAHDADAIPTAEGYPFRCFAVVCHRSKPRHRGD